MTSPASHKEYFEQAYRTGSDIWSHIPYHDVALAMFPSLPDDALVLDIGAGRGLFTFKLAERGLRAIGLDYIGSIVEKANADVVERRMTGKVKFIEGDALDIPFSDGGFDCVVDIGVFQYLLESEWVTYVEEAHRVLKDDGYLMHITLSKKTPRFLGFIPAEHENAVFEKFGVTFHFFDEQEVTELFGAHFLVIEQRTEEFQMRSDPDDRVALLFTLLKKI